MNDVIKGLNQIITTDNPMRRSAAVLLLAYLNRDHTDRNLALACVRYLQMERELGGRI